MIVKFIVEPRLRVEVTVENTEELYEALLKGFASPEGLTNKPNDGDFVAVPLLVYVKDSFYNTGLINVTVITLLDLYSNYSLEEALQIINSQFNAHYAIPENDSVKNIVELSSAITFKGEKYHRVFDGKNTYLLNTKKW